MPILYVNDDEAYFDWLSKHPNGFVLNISKIGTNGTNVCLHKANCWTIGPKIQSARKGSRSDIYQKVCCTAKAPLVAWARERKTLKPTFSEYECGHCCP